MVTIAAIWKSNVWSWFKYRLYRKRCTSFSLGPLSFFFFSYLARWLALLLSLKQLQFRNGNSQMGCIPVRRWWPGASLYASLHVLPVQTRILKTGNFKLSVSVSACLSIRLSDKLTFATLSAPEAVIENWMDGWMNGSTSNAGKVGRLWPDCCQHSSLILFVLVPPRLL